MAYGTLQTDVINASTGVFSTNNAYSGIAKAWVNFNGTNGAINGSFNVSSVTYVSTGTYTVNFTTAMANANYVVSLMSSIASSASNGTTNQLLESTTPTTSSFTWNNYKVGTGVFNPLYAHVAVFGA